MPAGRGGCVWGGEDGFWEDGEGWDGLLLVVSEGVRRNRRLSFSECIFCRRGAVGDRGCGWGGWDL